MGVFFSNGIIEPRCVSNFIIFLLVLNSGNYMVGDYEW